MTSIQEIKKKLKLNHPCEVCGETIYIGDGTIIEKKPVHFECFKFYVRQECLKDVLKMIEDRMKFLAEFGNKTTDVEIRAELISLKFKIEKELEE